ncbi:MAG: hypothetical protein CMI90_03845 [Pelagibacteraceae bacterium]|nr:hypothetical protein [Pelagibacteraceae bacterium]|tara:strand:+ start:310 stop:1053 length:744 start_codon:yes stop_codon:yes gene_type:complete
MKILVVNGWSEDGDKDHIKAGCILQTNIFVNIIKRYLPNVIVDVFNSYEFHDQFELKSYQAFMWTGGGGNIYDKNKHNKSQIQLCQEILELQKPIWGSCWGMQVLVSALGRKVVKTNIPEFGYSKNIKIINPILNNSIYKNKELVFDAPAHHYDIITEVPNGFEIISENNNCIQSIYSPSKNIFCTQYHPELPYDYIANLMIYWKNNYINYYTPEDFNNLIKYLRIKEQKDSGSRLLEIRNWLKYLV